jgi:uncharacterized protein YceH (UPF0502 family)
MYRFRDAAEIDELLASLCQKTKPVVQKIPRQSGQREDRYVHLLCGKPDIAVLSASTRPPPSGTSNSSLRALEERVEKLEHQLARLLKANGIDEDQ